MSKYIYKNILGTLYILRWALDAVKQEHVENTLQRLLCTAMIVMLNFI